MLGGRTTLPQSDPPAEVAACYRAALATGRHDNGPLGLRIHYHPVNYGAFDI
jgi:hypothetical protein